MNTITISAFVLAFLIAGLMTGAFLRIRFSEKQVDSDAKDVIKMAAAFLATLSALVLGLLVATAKTSFDTKIGEVKQLAANVILLDELLAQFGPEANNARQIGRRNFDLMVDRIWDEHDVGSSSRFEMNREAQNFLVVVLSLKPENDFQRTLKTRIGEAFKDLAQVRLLLFVQSGSTISMPFIMILTFWLTIIFAIFGLLTRINVLVGATLFVCALSVSASIFLIVDFDRAFEGIIKIPSAPLRNALPPLDH